MLEKVKLDLTSKLPEPLVDALLDSYQEMKHNYLLRNYEPTELNGGKFSEVVVRILQFETQAGSFSPLGTHIPNMIGKIRSFEQLPSSSANESYRIHIPRVLVAIYNVRNKRGVGHIGGDINPNHADATLLTSCADWVMAELFRIHYQCSLEKAQSIADLIVQRQLALVLELKEMKRVLQPSLSLRDQALILLSSVYPKKVQISDLISWIEPKDIYYFRNKIIKSLHRDRFIELDGDWNCLIIPPGLNYIEKWYPIWIAKLNEEM